VLVLEARNRIGGRICPGNNRFNGTPVDLGASWIHGMDTNPLAEYARELKLNLDVTNNPNLTSGEAFEIYDSKGERINPDIQRDLRSKFEQITERGRNIVEESEHDLSMEEMILRSSKKEGHEFKAEEMHFVDWLKAGLEGWDSSDLSDLSARNHFWEHFDAPALSGGDGFIIDGFYNIIEHLAKGLKDKILLGHAVENIEYLTSGVAVHTNNGTFWADYVICTIPLGVLKSNSVTFTPPLPPWKLESIDKIGMGLMNKIFLEFPEVFWTPNMEGLGYVSNVHRGEFGFFLALHQHLKKPVLLCFVAAEFAKKIEQWTDEKIIDRIMEILTQIYGKDGQLPRPKNFVMSRWGSDPYARGSYSFMRVSSTPEHLDDLAKPVGRVHFAGEATVKYPGYTHGAYHSAKREVERVLKRVYAEKRMNIEDSIVRPQIPQLVPAFAQASTLSKL